jgi:hypothetical protein
VDHSTANEKLVHWSRPTSLGEVVFMGSKRQLSQFSSLLSRRMVRRR